MTDQQWDKYKLYFRPHEFYTPDEKYEDMQESHIRMLYRARIKADIPFRITSGFRSKEHNTIVGGEKTSTHMKGMATDIYCIDSTKRFIIISALIDAGFTRIGIAKTFIHADNDKDKPQGVIWIY